MKKQFTLVLDEDLMEALFARAKTEGRNISNLIEFWMRKELKSPFPSRLVKSLLKQKREVVS